MVGEGMPALSTQVDTHLRATRWPKQTESSALPTHTYWDPPSTLRPVWYDRSGEPSCLGQALFWLLILLGPVAAGVVLVLLLRACDSVS